MGLYKELQAIDSRLDRHELHIDIKIDQNGTEIDYITREIIRENRKLRKKTMELFKKILNE